MSPVVETILFVFGLVALGYLAGLTGYLKVQVGDALTEFAVGVALPLLLFRTMVRRRFPRLGAVGLVGRLFLGRRRSPGPSAIS